MGRRVSSESTEAALVLSWGLVVGGSWRVGSLAILSGTPFIRTMHQTSLLVAAWMVRVWSPKGEVVLASVSHPFLTKASRSGFSIWDWYSARLISSLIGQRTPTMRESGMWRASA